MPWMGPRRRGRPGCRGSRSAIEQDAGEDLERERDAQQHAQDVAERPHDLDRVAHERDVHAEDGERDEVEHPDAVEHRRVAPEHGCRAPADEHEDRDAAGSRTTPPPATARRARARRAREAASAARRPGQPMRRADGVGREREPDRDERERLREAGRESRRARAGCRRRRPGVSGACARASHRGVASARGRSAGSGSAAHWRCFVDQAIAMSSTQPPSMRMRLSARLCARGRRARAAARARRPSTGAAGPRHPLGRSTARNHERQSAPITIEANATSPDDAELQPDVEPRVVRLQVLHAVAHREVVERLDPRLPVAHPAPAEPRALGARGRSRRSQMSRRPVRSSLLPKTAEQRVPRDEQQGRRMPRARPPPPSTRRGGARADLARPQREAEGDEHDHGDEDHGGRSREERDRAGHDEPADALRRGACCPPRAARRRRSGRAARPWRAGCGCATMPSMGPALEEQPARPVERHRHVVAGQSVKFGGSGSCTKIATHSSKSEREAEDPLDRAPPSARRSASR